MGTLLFRVGARFGGHSPPYSFSVCPSLNWNVAVPGAGAPSPRPSPSGGGGCRRTAGFLFVVGHSPPYVASFAWTVKGLLLRRLAPSPALPCPPPPGEGVVGKQPGSCLWWAQPTLRCCPLPPGLRTEALPRRRERGMSDRVFLTSGTSRSGSRRSGRRWWRRPCGRCRLRSRGSDRSRRSRPRGCDRRGSGLRRRR